MDISLEHDALKADLKGAAAALGIEVDRVDAKQPSMTGRIDRQRTLTLRLPAAVQVSARFVREGLLERAKKLFVEEVEVGSALFDDLIYVVSDTPERTRALLAAPRVQQALLLLVDETRYVEIEGNELRVVDSDSPDDGRDAIAEALAIAAHLLRA
jgi:hypothetical protein